MSSQYIHPHQDAVLAVALQLARLDHHLARIAASVPLPADADLLFEDLAPATPASHLYGVIEAVRLNLREAYQALLEGAQADEVQLRQASRRLKVRPS